MVGLTVPIAAWILLNSDFIVSVIFQRGAFNEQSVAITADVLSSMAPGLAAQCASYFLIKSLNAQDANRAVIGITLAGGAANIAFNLFAYKSLGIVTIGIGYTLQSWTTFILALHSIGLLRKSAGLLSLMGAGVVSYIFLTILFAPTEISRAITSTGFALLFWPIFFLFVPGIRDEIKAIATRISTKLNE
jgi:putative peptidoglycan lipid II flippase